MFHSFSSQKRLIIASVAIVILTQGLLVYAKITDQVWASYANIIITIVATIVILITAQRSEQGIQKVQTYIEHLGWRLDSSIDALSIRPKHLTSKENALEILNPTYSFLVYIPPPGLTSTEKWFIQEKTLAMNKGQLREYGSLGYLALRLPGVVSGWVRLLPEESGMMKPHPDSDLESHSFNQQVSMLAEPEEIGPLVMSPTFMEWYLQQAYRPWIHIEQNMCILSLGDTPSYTQMQELIRMSEEIEPLLKQSGALEKSS